jgi:hypothetical protein
LPAIRRRKAAAGLVRGERPSSHVVVIANPLRLVRRRFGATVYQMRGSRCHGGVEREFPPGALPISKRNLARGRADAIRLRPRPVAV